MNSDWPDDKLPDGMIATTAMVAMPADTNPAGDIFGGWIMSQVDLAGSVEAMCVASGRIATVAVNSFVFVEPVYVGDLVSFYTKLAKVGNTSVAVEVIVYAQRSRLRQEIVKVTHATLVYVALDDEDKPRPVRAVSA